MTDENRFDRPWGSFFILDDQEHTKVKRLYVKPGQRLSYQSHVYRDEHWVVVRGVAQVTLDDVTKDYQYGEHVFIKRGTKHRSPVQGRSPLKSSKFKQVMPSRKKTSPATKMITTGLAAPIRTSAGIDAAVSGAGAVSSGAATASRVANGTKCTFGTFTCDCGLDAGRG